MTDRNRLSHFTPAHGAALKKAAPVDSDLAENVTRDLTDEDRAALASIGESGIFTLEKSRGMYAGIQRLRDAV